MCCLDLQIKSAGKKNMSTSSNSGNDQQLRLWMSEISQVLLMIRKTILTHHSQWQYYNTNTETLSI